MHPNIKPFGKFSYSSGPIEIILFGSNCNNYLHVGKCTSISKYCKVFLNEGNHAYKTGTTMPLGMNFNSLKRIDHSQTEGDVRIGNDVLISLGTTILSGVTIGDGAVIAANSHVVSDVPPYAIYGGNPAKLIKYRFTQDIIDRFQEINWWDYSNDKLKKILPLLQLEPTKDILNLIAQPDNLQINEMASRYLDLRILYDELLHRPFTKEEMEKYLFSNIPLEQINQIILSSKEYKHVQ